MKKPPLKLYAWQTPFALKDGEYGSEIVMAVGLSVTQARAHVKAHHKLPAGVLNYVLSNNPNEVEDAGSAVFLTSYE